MDLTLPANTDFATGAGIAATAAVAGTVLCIDTRTTTFLSPGGALQVTGSIGTDFSAGAGISTSTAVLGVVFCIDAEITTFG